MTNNFKQAIDGKTILITGGTGSFGNSMTDKLLTFAPKKIIIFSRDEKKQYDMRNKYNSKILKFIIGDTRDRGSLEKIIDGVDYIFHAAALKQVPTCEFFPIEAVKTNIIGTDNVLSIAIKAGVKRVVVLSTDKAVYPINAMGMSKALLEKIMIAESKNINSDKTVLCGVRYGNVLYSRGSVVPLFVNQIKNRKQLTITDPLMTRFLLPLADAVDLVLYAFTHGENGSIYVRKAPAATIDTLARVLMKIFNYKKGFKIVGIRNGEKIHETLVAKEEMMRVADHDKYFEIPPETQDFDYNQYFDRGDKKKNEEIQSYTSENTQRLNVDETVKLLLSLPEISTDIQQMSK